MAHRINLVVQTLSFMSGYPRLKLSWLPCSIVLLIAIRGPWILVNWLKSYTQKVTRY
jgi:hypothetical protein